MLLELRWAQGADRNDFTRTLAPTIEAELNDLTAASIHFEAAQEFDHPHQHQLLGDTGAQPHRDRSC